MSDCYLCWASDFEDEQQLPSQISSPTQLVDIGLGKVSIILGLHETFEKVGVRGDTLIPRAASIQLDAMDGGVLCR